MATDTSALDSASCTRLIKSVTPSPEISREEVATGRVQITLRRIFIWARQVDDVGRGRRRGGHRNQ